MGVQGEDLRPDRGTFSACPSSTCTVAMPSAGERQVRAHSPPVPASDGHLPVLKWYLPLFDSFGDCGKGSGIGMVFFLIVLIVWASCGIAVYRSVGWSVGHRIQVQNSNIIPH